MPKPQKVDVVPYDPNWPLAFKAEAEKIKLALGSNCLEVHHMGSTSVPGLSAKPILDLIPVVKDILAVDVCTSSMSALGYESKGEFGIPFRRFFKKAGVANVHVYEAGNPEIERHLKFRDWLITHPEDKGLYEGLKQALAQKYPDDIFSYCAGKSAFVAQIDAKAGFEGLRFVSCMDPAEWAAAKSYRDTYFFKPDGIEDPYEWTFEHEDHRHFVLYQANEISGYAHVQLWPDHRAALRILVIDPSKRRHGYGRVFMLLIEKWLKQKGYMRLQTESSPSAVTFYEGLQYVPMAFDDPDGYESDPEDVSLGKEL